MPEETLRTIFAKNLRYYLERAGKNQTDLCKYMNVSSATASDWCNGRKMPRADKIQSMASWLGVNIGSLMEEKTPALTAKDERDIAKDLESIMRKLSDNEDGPASFEGTDIPEADQELFAGQLELMLRRLKAINKDLYNPTKNKK